MANGDDIRESGADALWSAATRRRYWCFPAAPMLCATTFGFIDEIRYWTAPTLGRDLKCIEVSNEYLVVGCPKIAFDVRKESPNLFDSLVVVALTGSLCDCWGTCHFLGTPRSLQIFLARRSSISRCLGTAERLFSVGLCHQECRPP